MCPPLVLFQWHKAECSSLPSQSDKLDSAILDSAQLLNCWCKFGFKKTGKLSRISHSSMKFVSGTIKIWAKVSVVKYRNEKGNGMAVGVHFLFTHNLRMYG